MNRNLAFGFLLVSISFGQQTSEAPKEITVESYWYNKALDRVLTESDSGDYIVGTIQARHAVSPFRVNRNKAQGKDARTRGVKMAVEELIAWIDSNLAEYATTRLAKLTGETHLRGEWIDWFRTNGPYLSWSTERQQLVVDEEAKQQQVPTEQYRKTHPWGADK